MCLYIKMESKYWLKMMVALAARDSCRCFYRPLEAGRRRGRWRKSSCGRTSPPRSQRWEASPCWTGCCPPGSPHRSDNAAAVSFKRTEVNELFCEGITWGQGGGGWGRSPTVAISFCMESQSPPFKSSWFLKLHSADPPDGEADTPWANTLPRGATPGSSKLSPKTLEPTRRWF